MMTADYLLRVLERVGKVTKVFTFPYVKVFVESPIFTSLNDGEREVTLADALKVSVEEIRQSCVNSLLLLRPISPEEAPVSSKGRSTHWLAGLTGTSAPSREQSIRAIHFYGYKGGQARSTILAETAMSLAADGWRVLVVDADVEAPSLDTLFSASSSSLGGTLLGISQGAALLRPITVYVEDDGQRGLVDVFNCWPKGNAYSIDATAFTLRSALDPSVLERAVERIKTFATEKQYDVVLVDHRTGISTSTLPIMASLPGTTVVAVRLDEQWRPARQFLRLVLNASFPEPGVFVAWKPDSEESRSFGQRTYRQREDLLDMLAETFFTPGQDDENVISGSDIEDHLIVWPYDSAFRTQRLPEPHTLDGANQEALVQLRSLLALGHKFPAAPERVSFNISGAKDRGDLIITRALRELLSPANPFAYILGRKGTGKTRLARELSARGQGEPLLIANDSEDTNGIRAGAAELLDAIENCSQTPERFWLAMFDAGMQAATTQREGMIARFQQGISDAIPATEIIARWQRQGTQRTFLLDSLETTFPNRHMATFLDSLFRVLSMIEGEPRIADQIRFRLFLRRDLAQPGFVQNIEQKLYGKSLELSWDYQSILNFMLSRISQSSWYGEHFPELSSLLAANKETIREGKMQTLECEELLLRAFPSNVKRNNLSTVTFLRTYFADSASDRGPTDAPSTDDVRRYYPRVFDDFLSEIPGELTDQNGISLPLLEGGRISQQRIFRAHENATNNYLSGLKQELAYLVNLAPDLGENPPQLEKLLNAFDGLRTPFKLDLRVGELSRTTGIAAEAVRTALEKMKDVGMFETRPDYPGEWRAGRLFKSSLRMKYGRGRASQD
jgi:MinD-like ATPase involved in chromosome partitioning or flagellar assembly